MKYKTQKVAYAYFLAAMAVFAVQVLGGLWAGWIYISPNFMADLMPFNIIRMLHTNSLIVWLLLGFFRCGVLPGTRRIGTRNPFAVAGLYTAGNSTVGNSRRCCNLLVRPVQRPLAVG